MYSHIPDIEQCIQSFIVALKGCTAFKGDEDLQSLGYAMSSALNYFCQHDGDGIVSKSTPNAVYTARLVVYV